MERVFTTLIRDQHLGLGFSISGGKGAEPFIDGSDAIYISKVAEDGPAAKDAKLMVGDKVIQVAQFKLIVKIFVALVIKVRDLFKILTLKYLFRLMAKM